MAIGKLQYSRYRADVKFDIVDENDNYPLMEHVKDEVTIENEVFYRQTYGKLNQYGDLLLNAPRQCSVCDRIFPNSYSFLQHNIQHLVIKLEKLQLYKCKKCPQILTNSTDFEAHTRGHGSTKINFEKCNLIDKFECNLCGVVINSLANLKRHIANSHLKLHKECEHCGKLLKKRYYRAHIKKVHSSDKVQCDLCCKMFKSNESLNKHKMFIHQKAKTNCFKSDTFICDLCNRSYKNKYLLVNHLKQCERVKCVLCNAILKTKQILRNHMRWVHFDDGKAHDCDVCGKTFRTPSNVKTHKKNCHNR